MVHRTDRRMGVEGRMLPLPALSSPGETCCKLPVGPGQGCAPWGAQCHGTEQREGTWEPPAQGDLGPRRADVSGPLTLQVLGEVTAVTVRGIRWCQPKVPGDDTWPAPAQTAAPASPTHGPSKQTANPTPTATGQPLGPQAAALPGPPLLVPRSSPDPRGCTGDPTGHPHLSHQPSRTCKGESPARA